MGTTGDSQEVTTASVHSIDDAENQRNNAQRNDVVNPVRSWKSYVWDTWDLPPDQRWLLFKVDAFVLTFASVGYFLKNIDQTNVNNAFLSGMEEDLEMFGNQLVTSTCFRSRLNRFFLSFFLQKSRVAFWHSLTSAIGTSIWTVGYVIGQIPSNLLLTRVSPRWVIPSLELGWGLATICTSSVKSYKSLYALRFLVGLFEYVDIPILYLL